MEQWKAIKGYEDCYEVSDMGNVRSKTRTVNTSILHNDTRVIKGRLLKNHVKQNGYPTVDLCKNGIVHSCSVHRLVAETFIENPDNLKVVNHKNGIKTDNCVDNLEWVTYRENHWHARNTGLLNNIGQHNNKCIKCVETDMVFINSVKAGEWLIQTNNPRITHNNAKKLGQVIRSAIARNIKAYGYTWTNL